MFQINQVDAHCPGRVWTESVISKGMNASVTMTVRFVFWFALQEEQERRSGIKEPSHSDSDSSSGSKKYVKTTVAQLLRIEDFF